MHESENAPQGWRGVVFDARLALSFLTRLPVPGTLPYVPGALARSMRLFPVAGAVVGLIGGGVFALARMGVPSLVAALLAILATILVTGALHEDGLADTADGLGARGDIVARLDVMRDSRSGSFGVLALVFSVGLRAAALAAAPHAWAACGALVAAGALSRAIVPGLMQFVPPARADGLGAAAGTPHAGIAAAALVLACILAGLASGGGAAVAIVAAIVAGLAVCVVARRRFGGYTGDILGAAQQMAEIAVLLTLAGGWK